MEIHWSCLFTGRVICGAPRRFWDSCEAFKCFPCTFALFYFTRHEPLNSCIFIKIILHFNSCFQSKIKSWIFTYSCREWSKFPPSLLNFVRTKTFCGSAAIFFCLVEKQISLLNGLWIYTRSLLPKSLNFFRWQFIVDHFSIFNDALLWFCFALFTVISCLLILISCPETR